MSVCSIEIILDPSHQPYHAGGRVSGHLNIVPMKEVDAKECRIEFQWRTHGRGNVDSEMIDTIAFDPPAWAPNELQKVPFSFQIPEHPASHSGTLLNVEYTIEAGLNRGWFRNDNAKCSILVRPKPNIPPEIPTTQRVESVGATPMKMGWLPAMILILVGGFSGPLSIYLTESHTWLYEPTESPWPFVIILAGSIGCLSFGLFLLLRWRTRQRKLGIVDVVVRPARASEHNEPASTAITVELQHRPSGSLQVVHVDMFLEYRELTWSGAGTDRTRTTHEQRIRTERVGSSLTLLPGQVFKEHAVLVLPETAAPSFRSTDNEVAWVVGVEMEIDGFPTLRYEKGLWIY